MGFSSPFLSLERFHILDIMKSLTKLSIALYPILGLVSTAQADVGELADSLKLHVTGQAILRSESNVTQRSTGEISDLSMEYVPGLELNIGKKGAALNAKVAVKYHIIEFNDQKDLNAENDDFSAVVNYKSAGLTSRAFLSYVEQQSNTDVYNLNIASLEPGLVSRSEVNGGVYGELAVSPKTKLGTGFTYTDQNYVNAGYTGFSTLTIPVDLFMAISAKTDLVVGASYSPVKIGDNDSADAIDSRLTVGLRGEILPKVTGSARVGWMSREGRGNLDDKNGISLEGNLMYSMSPLVDLNVKLMRGYSVSPTTSNTTLRTGVLTFANYKLSKQFNLGGSFGYIMTEYEDSSDRDDNYLTAGAYMTYAPNEYLNVRVAYTYNDNDSNKQSVDFKNSILSVSASFRY